MADRSGAHMAAIVFCLLAKDPSEDHKAIARDFWRELRHFDFNWQQMFDDYSPLIQLGLVREIDQHEWHGGYQAAESDGVTFKNDDPKKRPVVVKEK